MKPHNIRIFRRLAAAALAGALAAAPIDWTAAGRTLAVTAAAMTQPEAAAQLLAERLDENDAVDGCGLCPPLPRGGWQVRST